MQSTEVIKQCPVVGISLLVGNGVGGDAYPQVKGSGEVWRSEDQWAEQIALPLTSSEP